MKAQTLMFGVVCVSVVIILFLLAISAKSDFEYALAYSQMVAFQDIVDSYDNRILSSEDALKGIKDYYPMGTTFDKESRCSRIVELARSASIKYIETKAKLRNAEQSLFWLPTPDKPIENKNLVVP